MARQYGITAKARRYALSRQARLTKFFEVVRARAVESEVEARDDVKVEGRVTEEFNPYKEV